MVPLLVGAGVLLVVGTILVILAARSSGGPVAAGQPGVTRSRTLATGRAASQTVEVPAVAGGSLRDAQLVLDTAGFKVEITYEEQATGAAGTVLAQDPVPGVLVAEGATIRLVVAGSKTGNVSASAATAPAATPERQFIVVVDPGHQEHSDQGQEPVGPGSNVKKAKVAGGTTGIVTRVSEYEITLQLATNLAARLKRAGVKVVMTRTTNDVNISNAERAAIANRSKADLFVRIHANGSPDSKKAGVSTLYPAANRWGRPYSAKSKQAAVYVQHAVLEATGAMDDGVVARTDLAGFNYAKEPSVLVECGYMSNPVEDRLLGSPHYQDKVAQGVAEGVLEYLERTR